MVQAPQAPAKVADKASPAEVSTEVSLLTDTDIVTFIRGLNQGTVNRDDLSAQTDAVLATVAEVLLELGHDEWFDDNNAFTGGKFTNLVAELLGVNNGRAARVMKIMRQHQAYSFHGRKIVFTGTEKARSIVAQLDVEGAKDGVEATQRTATATAASTTPQSFATSYTVTAEADRDLPFPTLARHRIGTTLVLEGLTELTGRDKLLANIIADRIITDTGGDPELIAGTLYELATRVGQLLG